MARLPRRVPRGGRALFFAGMGLLCLEAAYLLGARWWLGSEGLTTRLNRRPERFQLLWSTATSPWPGLLRARGVELRVQTGSVQWWMTADKAWATVDLFALARRQLRFTTPRARGGA